MSTVQYISNYCNNFPSFGSHASAFIFKILMLLQKFLKALKLVKRCSVNRKVGSFLPLTTHLNASTEAI